MDIATHKECLQDLRAHVEATEALLQRLDITSFCMALDEIKEFLSAEEVRLLLEQKKEEVRPFFELRSEVPTVQTVLSKCQQILTQKLDVVQLETDMETVLHPYVQLLDAMKCHDPVKKLDYMFKLGDVLPHELIACTLVQRDALLADAAVEKQYPAHEAAQSEEPTMQEKAPAEMTKGMNDPKGKILSATEHTISVKVVDDVAVSKSEVHIEELNDLTEQSDSTHCSDDINTVSDEAVSFFRGLLMPQDYDYGRLDIQCNAKGEKEVGVSQLKSDIRKRGFLESTIRIALRQLSKNNITSEAFLQAQLHGLKDEEAGASLQFLQKSGYIKRYMLNNTDAVYCPSHKLHKLLRQKMVCRYLKVDQEKDDDNNNNLIEHAEAKHVVTRLAWLSIYEKYCRDIPRGYSMQAMGGCNGATFQMLIRWNHKDPHDIMLGFFENQVYEVTQQLWQTIVELARVHGTIQRLTLAGMDRSHVVAFHEKLRGIKDMQCILTGQVYYYVQEEKSFFTSAWEKVDPKYAPVVEALSVVSAPIEPEKVPAVIQVEEVEEESPAIDNVMAESVTAAAETVDITVAGDTVVDPVKETKVKQHQAKVLTETQREEILTHVMHAICQGSICSATAYLKYWSQVYEEMTMDYQQLAYAVHDPSMPLRYTSEKACALFSGEVSVFRQYLELTLACRTFFYNDIEYDYLAPTLQDMVTGTNLMSSALSNVLYQLVKFKKTNQKGIDVYANYRTKDQHSTDVALKQLRSEAGDYVTNIIDKRSSEQKAQKRFIEMKKLIFNPDGDLGTYLQVIYDNNVPMLPLLKDYLQEKIILDKQPLIANNISHKKVEMLVDDAWEKAASHIRLVKRNSRLMGSLRNNILTAVTKMADLFCRWCQIADKVSAQGESSGQIAYQKVRGDLLEQLTEALDKLVPEKGISLQEKAGRVILRRCLQELKARLLGSYDPSMERYFYIDFLRTDYVLLDEDYLPDFQHWMYIDEPVAYSAQILSYAENSLPDFSQRMEKIFEEGGDNYLSARLIEGYLQAKGQTSLIQAKGYALAESIECAKSAIIIQQHNFAENLELAQSYGQLDTTEDNQKDDILQVVNDCYKYAMRSNNFGVFRRVKEYYEQKIKNDARQRGAVLEGEVKQNRLMIDEQAEDAAELKARLDSIEHMIKLQNYTVAEDALNRWRDQDTEDFNLFTSEDHLKDFMENYEIYYNPVKNSGVSLLRNGHNKEERGAGRLAESWIRSRQSTSDEQIRKLLQNLGWRVDKAEAEANQEKVQTFRITLQKALNGKKSNYTHPIAVFGSVAEQDGFRVACLYGRFDTDSLIETFKELGNTKPTLVFLDFALELAERRRLARKIKHELYGKKAFLLVDRVIIMYLMKHYNETKVSRILMRITMPFSIYQPYVWESSNIMPAEMFMGRHKELADIENPNGANIVYGGRQLGKSALLKMAVKDIDHDENDNRAILIDIKGRDYKATARRISQELSDQKFFTSGLDTEDWDELARAIRQRLRDDTAPVINYFLLMLDEADVFIESCRAVDFAPFDALKDIQGIAMNRFKFVIAGLRNIIRFDRQKALSNNSVLTHLTSMTVKPFRVSEARELLEVPLSYLGFRFPEDNKHLISMILANANYFPGLIQLYCAKLIEAMSGQDYAKYDQSETPIYEIKEDHIKKVLASQGFRDQIREKFEITLKLGEDKYYYIIALTMAYLYHQQGYYRGYMPEEVLYVVQDYEMHEFDDFTAEKMEALMEELRELNVFRKNTEGRYLFARYTFFQMMGNKDEVDAKILAMMEEEA